MGLVRVCARLSVVAVSVIQTVLMVVHIIAAMTVMVLHVMLVADLLVEEIVSLVVTVNVILMDVI